MWPASGGSRGEVEVMIIWGPYLIPVRAFSATPAVPEALLGAGWRGGKWERGHGGFEVWETNIVGQRALTIADLVSISICGPPPLSEHLRAATLLNVCRSTSVAASHTRRQISWTLCRAQPNRDGCCPALYRPRRGHLLRAH